MTDYVKSTNFASKDSLSIGNPLKIVKGTEIDTEFNNIATAVATKADIANPTFTGVASAPTAGAGTNTTQLATTAFVTAAVTAYDTSLTVATGQIENGAVTPSKLSTGAPTWFGDGKTGVGVASPQYQLHVGASSPTRGIVGEYVADGGTGSQILFHQATIDYWAVGQPAGVSAFAVWRGRYSGSDGTEVFRVDNSNNLQFNSGYGSVATAYGCRAWVNFNGTGTVAIRASGNVSSITDNGTGDYTVNLSTTMPDVNYSAVNQVSRAGNNSVQFGAFTYGTGSFRMSTAVNQSGSAIDPDQVNVAIFR
jgi:hypothetical protein